MFWRPMSQPLRFRSFSEVVSNRLLVYFYYVDVSVCVHSYPAAYIRAVAHDI
jgi:hypothetical protein